MNAQYYWKSLLSLIYKNDCLACRKSLQLEEDYLCLHCIKKIFNYRSVEAIELTKIQFDETVFILELNATVKKLIHQWKYNKKEWIIHLFKPFIKRHVFFKINLYPLMGLSRFH